MEQLDKAATQNVLRAMSVAGVNLDELAARTGIRKHTLLRRMSTGPWKLQELGLIAKAVGVRPEDLVSGVAA
ncbi:helix-turn-helix domain-containing protein [Nocardia sp. NPDC004260]